MRQKTLNNNLIFFEDKYLFYKLRNKINKIEN